VNSPVASPGTVINGNSYIMPITKDGSANQYRASFSHNYYCAFPPCLLMSALYSASAAATTTAFSTSLSVTALRST
jgi:hypothetical protein